MVFSTTEYKRRISEAVSYLKRLGGDYIVVTPSPNMIYFTGIREETLERLMALFINVDGEALLLAPQLVKLDDYLRDFLDIVVWSDSTGPGPYLDKIVRDLRIFGRRGFFEDSMRLGDLEFLREKLSPEKIFLLSKITRDLRYRKSVEELTKIFDAVKKTEKILMDLYNILVPGVSERFVEMQITNLIASEGLEPSFKPIIAFGENTANPHHRPTNRLLRLGDLVLVDVGVRVEEGYVSDLTRLYMIGTPSRDLRNIFETYKNCYEETLRSIKTNVRASEIDIVSRSCLTDNGLGRYIVHRTGHGIGVEVHEPPYLSINSDDVLERRVVFTVEPGIYIQGSFGVRVESNITISDDDLVIEIDKLSREIIIY
ncbi:MAG: M24 family metallopeptidase [Desulfurococcales archaeon]|jgi:Xaa-Pro dipeptidase|nr:M24 family metallopeptidase [Desulfurococcales archaeon]